MTSGIRKKIAHLLNAIRLLERDNVNALLLVHCDLEVADERLGNIHPSFLHYQGLRHTESSPLRTLLSQNLVTGARRFSTDYWFNLRRLFPTRA